MTYIARLATAPEVQDEYELFTTEEVEAVDGSKVEVKKSLGRFRLDQLEEQKKNLLAQIAEIDEKIASITAL